MLASATGDGPGEGEPLGEDADNALAALQHVFDQAGHGDMTAPDGEGSPDAAGAGWADDGDDFDGDERAFADGDSAYYDERGGPGPGSHGGDYGYDDEPLVEVRSGVLPYEIWMQQHAAKAEASSGGARTLETPVLSEKQWDHLVTRLNE